MSSKFFLIVLGSLAVVPVSGCGSSRNHDGPTTAEPGGNIVDDSASPTPSVPGADSQQSAQAELEGDGISGMLDLTMQDGILLIDGTIRGLSPGQHAIHIHENGICEGPDFMSAGDHFNPDDMPHGGPLDTQHHAGDLGNLSADADGSATFSFRSTVLSLEGPKSAIGRALIIHEKMDDFTAQPSGDSGSRVACGVVVPTTATEDMGDDMDLDSPDSMPELADGGLSPDY